MNEDSKYSQLHSELSKNRVIFLTEDITKELASSLCSLLLYYNAQSTTDDIHLFINTCGGDALALTSIYDVMCLVDAPISTIGIGKIYSAGVFILGAGTAGKRFMFKNAEVMIHGIQCVFPEMPGSDFKYSETYYKYLESLNSKMLKILSKHTGQPVATIIEDSKRDLFLDARQSMKYGLIDKIL